VPPIAASADGTILDAMDDVTLVMAQRLTA